MIIIIFSNYRMIIIEITNQVSSQNILHVDERIFRISKISMYFAKFLSLRQCRVVCSRMRASGEAPISQKCDWFLVFLTEKVSSVTLLGADVSRDFFSLWPCLRQSKSKLKILKLSKIFPCFQWIYFLTLKFRV